MKIRINNYNYPNNKSNKQRNQKCQTDFISFRGNIKVPPIISSAIDDIFKLTQKVVDPYDSIDFIGDLATDDD